MVIEIMKIIINSLIFFLLISNQAVAEFKTVTKKEFLDRNLKILEKRFDLIDTNKDQKIDAKENKAWQKKVLKARQERINQINKQRAELAKKIDKNKDGKLSKQEIEDYKKNNKAKK